MDVRGVGGAKPYHFVFLFMIGDNYFYGSFLSAAHNQHFSINMQSVCVYRSYLFFSIDFLIHCSARNHQKANPKQTRHKRVDCHSLACCLLGLIYVNFWAFYAQHFFMNQKFPTGRLLIGLSRLDGAYFTLQFGWKVRLKVLSLEGHKKVWGIHGFRHVAGSGQDVKDTLIK